MQRVTMVRYTTRPEAADENERLSRAVFEEVRERQPEGVSYALFRAGDEFIHLFVNWREDDSESVTGLPSFLAFSSDQASRLAGPPEIARLSAELVDSYTRRG